MARSGEPFFLYVGSTEPHDPWNKGDQSLWNPNDLTLPCNLVDTPATRKQFRNYLAEINELDNQVGAVDALLHKYGLDETRSSSSPANKAIRSRSASGPATTKVCIRGSSSAGPGR